MILESINPDIRSILFQLEEKEIDLDPEFQRGDVWNTQKQQLLIDTIMRGWEIPPIFFIKNADRDIKEVLDGHQRLRAIKSFFLGYFKFNGGFHPHDADLKQLDGLKYKDFPEPMKKRFRTFPLRTFLISDYAESEPFELFYRLNQNMQLTSAERRNTLFGVARNTTKIIVENMISLGCSADTIGFNNTRLGYNDVIARVLLSLEKGAIDKKINDSEITERYRNERDFDKVHIDKLVNVLNVTMSTIGLIGKVKFNKPTLYSYLLFCCSDLTDLNGGDLSAVLSLFNNVSQQKSFFKSSDTNIEKLILNEFSLRVSTGVNDARSVLFRHFFFNWIANETGISSLSINSRQKVIDTLSSFDEVLLKNDNVIGVQDILMNNGWGCLNA